MTMYVCLEGGEGCYKTTTAKALADHYRNKGLKVLETKEPGTTHIPLTVELRKIMLSNEYDQSLTANARELISQAIRSIHIERLVIPELLKGEYDLIIQDRGVLSGRIYAEACGHLLEDIQRLEDYVLSDFYHRYSDIYDHVFIFHNADGLKIAINAKDEFGSGDAMESRGDEFHEFVNSKFKSVQNDGLSYTLSHPDVAGKTTEMLVKECARILGL